MKKQSSLSYGRYFTSLIACNQDDLLINSISEAMVNQGTAKGVSKKGNFFQKGNEIRRCDDLRCRIRTYCRQQSITLPQLAERMGVSTGQMRSFSAGSSLTGSEVYSRGMKYLRLKMPMSQCSAQERDQMDNNKWGLTFTA